MVKTISRKTSNYNANIVIDVNGMETEVCMCYATFTTGEGINKSIIIRDEQLYIDNSELINAQIEIFNKEVNDLAIFHGVPVV